MFLSRLTIDVGSDPALARPGRSWLGNLYRVHQRLCMAFPSPELHAADPDFLAPYDPKEFAGGHVRVERGADSGFLFRVEPFSGGTAALLVQSAIEPDWDYAFRNAGHLLAAPPETRPYDPRFAAGATLRFRLVANPTRKIDTKSGPDGKRRNGRRVPVADDRLVEWLAERGHAAGFAIDAKGIVVHTGFVRMMKPAKEAERETSGKSVRLRSVRFDGTLEVTDPKRLHEAIARGIGAEKAFGFGLLSVAPRVEAGPPRRP